MTNPRQYQGVVVSSTYEDLKEHRAALMSAIEGQQLHAVAMEADSARPVTVIESSLEKVRDAAAYIAIIGRRYGSVPACDQHNPDGLSLTHLEFREAVRLRRPILVFLMGAGHLVTEDGVELDPDKRVKLAKFREEAKFAGGTVHQVYREFDDLASFATAAAQSVAELRRVLDAAGPVVPQENEDLIPVAPALYAKPRYLGSHDFVGREAQLETLNDWARPSGQHSALLFEAIGGSGKSILTWEWVTRHAPGVRGDWAGRFWYSFYESGAVMTDFCRRALAYMTGKPLHAFARRNPGELADLLVLHLESKPWLLVLDGLERVLVAYHRHDAAQVRDEDAGGSDEIARRDPCAAIRPEDDDLVRRLAGAAPSKILITSRLVPRVLLNQSSQPIPGVLHERLPGLRPADAEALMRACGVRGESRAMQSYLQRHCDCHPLVTGIVAGLVNDYLPARGDFDAWSGDLEHGGSLDVGELDLIQKRNHVLRRAVDALPGPSSQLLSTLSLLPDAVDYTTLDAFNPHDDIETSARDLARTVSDLERRGLLQYDRQARRYDLHPVVRAVVASDLGEGDREILGSKVVDHFSVRATRRYVRATSLDQLRDALMLVRSLLRVDRLKEAADVYLDGLDGVLRHRFEAYPEMLSLMRPFFGEEWSSLTVELPDVTAAALANSAASALTRLADLEPASGVYEVALRCAIRTGDPAKVLIELANLGVMLVHLDRFAASRRVRWMNLDLAQFVGNEESVYVAHLGAFWWLAKAGRAAEADEMWNSALARGVRRNDSRVHCEAALHRAGLLLDLDALAESELMRVEEDSTRNLHRFVMREAQLLRGRWHERRGEWHLAAAALSEAVRMAREVGIHYAEAEAFLALVQLRLGRLDSPAETAARLAAEPHPAHWELGRLWLAIGDIERAGEHALAAYRKAWADGPPHVHAFDLERARQLLVELGAEIPVLPDYHPACDPALPWEAEVRAFMEALRP